MKEGVGMVYYVHKSRLNGVGCKYDELSINMFKVVNSGLCIGEPPEGDEEQYMRVVFVTCFLTSVTGRVLCRFDGKLMQVMFTTDEVNFDRKKWMVSDDELLDVSCAVAGKGALEAFFNDVASKTDLRKTTGLVHLGAICSSEQDIVFAVSVVLVDAGEIEKFAPKYDEFFWGDIKEIHGSLHVSSSNIKVRKAVTDCLLSMRGGVIN